MSTSLKSCLCRSPVADSEYGGGVKKLSERSWATLFVSDCRRGTEWKWSRMYLE
jgi:hypothetical protein